MWRASRPGALTPENPFLPSSSSAPFAPLAQTSSAGPIRTPPLGIERAQRLKAHMAQQQEGEYAMKAIPRPAEEAGGHGRR